MRAARLAALLAAAAALAPAGAAAAEDYTLSDDAWNGVGYLRTTAEEAKVDLRPLARLDLARLRPEDVLLWLHPTAPMPVEDLLAFVREGGYLIVADDEGRAAPLLAAAGLTLDPAGPRAHGAWYEGQEGLPVLTPRGRHFLFFNVEEVTANYPAALRGAGEVILGFDDGRSALIVEQRLGDGALLAIADPSLFLNEMLRRFYGNKQLAANVMRLYCDREICPVQLVLPGVEAVGRYRRGIGRLGRLPALADAAATRLNDAVERLNGWLGRAPWVHVLAGLLALALAGVLARVVRDRRRRPSTPPLRLGIDGASPAREEARGLVMGQGDADFAEPVRILLEEAERLHAQAADARLLDPVVDGSGADGSQRGLARNALLRIQREADSVLGPEPTVVSAERFLRLVTDVRTLSRYLEQRPHGKLRTHDGAPRRAAGR